jgi:hypothetical protein
MGAVDARCRGATRVPARLLVTVDIGGGLRAWELAWEVDVG